MNILAANVFNVPSNDKHGTVVQLRAVDLHCVTPIEARSSNSENASFDAWT